MEIDTEETGVQELQELQNEKIGIVPNKIDSFTGFGTNPLNPAASMVGCLKFRTS
jgi:hypothetical protein